jgi:hypothetical protein
MGARVEAGYATVDEYLAVFEDEISAGGLILDGVEPGALTPGQRCLLVIVVGEQRAEAEALIGSVSGGSASFLFAEVPPPFVELAHRLRDPIGEESRQSPRGATIDRLAAMTASQKMQLALAGGREDRAALLRDPNRMLQTYVLRNPRIGLDEVQAAAKLAALSPEALALIAEHPEWGNNPVVCSAVVRNPKTPITLAVRLLDRVSEGDVRQIAKGVGRAALVAAARRKLNL